MTYRTTTILMMAWLGLAGCGGNTLVDPGSGGSDGGSDGTGAGSVGGAGQGGSAQGGGNQGGSGQGGSGQGGQGGAAVAECTTAEQCQLEDSCCNCQGLPADEGLPVCTMDCFAPLCTPYSPQPVEEQCRAGRCVTNIDCDPSDVICLALPPSCPAGQTPSVAGGCWGPCLPATECAEVGGCDQCGADQACVAEVAQLGPVFHCVELPGSCNGKADCDCLGDSVCVGAFNQCSDAPDGIIECHCPAC